MAPLSFQVNVRKLKKVISIAFADRHLFQDSISSLFKANMAREKRKKNRKANGNDKAFRRVLTHKKRTSPKHEKPSPPPNEKRPTEEG